MKHERQYSRIDQLLIRVDEALRLSTGAAPSPARPNPAADLPDTALATESRQHVAGLMRVNHAGEICAQALYAGQAATARDQRVREAMQQAANQEIHHLAWCESRLDELASKPSLLNPLW